MEPGANPPAGGDGGDMDDILASIRRILHSDDAEAAATEKSAPAAAPSAEEIIDLHPSMRVNAEPAPRVTADRLDDSARTQPDPGAHLPDALLDAETAAESAASLAALRAAMAERQAPSPAQPSTPIYRVGGLTIEDVVRDEVRVLLKTWLDENLPPMVERMVRAEIARIANQP